MATVAAKTGTETREDCLSYALNAPPAATLTAWRKRKLPDLNVEGQGGRESVGGRKDRIRGES